MHKVETTSNDSYKYDFIEVFFYICEIIAIDCVENSIFAIGEIGGALQKFD